MNRSLKYSKEVEIQAPPIPEARPPAMKGMAAYSSEYCSGVQSPEKLKGSIGEGSMIQQQALGWKVQGPRLSQKTGLLPG